MRGFSGIFVANQGEITGYADQGIGIATPRPAPGAAVFRPLKQWF
jgi:hypothetical protein